MLKFSSIGQIEKKYTFEDAVIDTDMTNGAFGSVEDGKFTTSANATKAIMQLEVGDNAGLDVYPIPKGSHVRVVDLVAYDGESFEVYGYPLPDTYAVGDKLKSDANGKLVNGATAAPYLEVTDIIGNRLGAKVTVVATAPATSTKQN